jgi:large subunit ribosomal protein L29
MAKEIKMDDLKGKSADELKKLLLEKKKEQMNLRFQASGGQLSDTAQMRTIRRDIARIKTVMGQETKKAGAKAA